MSARDYVRISLYVFLPRGYDSSATTTAVAASAVLAVVSQNDALERKVARIIKNELFASPYLAMSLACLAHHIVRDAMLVSCHPAHAECQVSPVERRRQERCLVKSYHGGLKDGLVFADSV